MKILKKYIGSAYRVDSGFTPPGSAADVVRFETIELGNELGISADTLTALESYPASAVCWVARDVHTAMRYIGDAAYRSNLGAAANDLVDTVHVTGWVILYEDGDGVLVWDKASLSNR